MTAYPPFSLLMAVYDGDDPRFLCEAFQSVVDNTILPDELVLVLDGPVSGDLLQVIDAFSRRLPFHIVRLERNSGLGIALSNGLLACTHEWIARFDSDDICLPHRFEKQLRFIAHMPDIDAFSAPIMEFQDSVTDDDLFVRDVPRGKAAILKYARWRNPLNHMSVMFRKSCALKAGNYQNELSFEDYLLWIRMLLNGVNLGNMEEVVVYARAGAALTDRRGGVHYIRREFEMHRKLLKWGFIGYGQFVLMLCVKIPIRVFPRGLRLKFYHTFMRRKASHA